MEDLGKIHWERYVHWERYAHVRTCGSRMPVYVPNAKCAFVAQMREEAWKFSRAEGCRVDFHTFWTPQ